MRKRLIMLLLLAVLAATVILASCANEDEGSDDSSTTTSGIGAGGGGDDEIEYIPDFGPFPHEVRDFEDRTFNIFVADEDWNYLFINDYDLTSEDTGEVLNEAIYTRNTYVEDTFNIKLNGIHIPRDQVSSSLTKAINSGTNDYDLIAVRLRDAGVIAQNGQAVAINNTEYIDTTQPWWDQNITVETSVGGNSYMIAGDIFTKHYDAIAMIYFNKKMLADYSIEDPYKLVESNQWTIDKFSELTKNLYIDIDQSGTRTPADQYGFSMQADALSSFINGCGSRLASKDADDIPIFTGYTDKISTIIDKIFTFYRDNTFCSHRDAYDVGVTDDTKILQFLVFPEGRSLFFWGMPRFMDLGLRSMEQDFGILPIPKYDSNQTRYYSTVNTWHSYAYMIPICTTDADDTSYVMEAMAYYGRQYILPAYYDSCLERKYTRDEESRAMLKIIFESTTYEMLDMYRSDGYLGNLENMLKTGENTIASIYESNSATITSNLEKLIANFEKAAGN